MLKFLPWLTAAVSGAMVAASFAPLEYADVAWVSLVPLLLSCRTVDLRKAAQLGFLAGTVCWLLSVFWLTHVSIVGWIILSLYCALYFIPIAVAFVGWTRAFGRERWWSNLLLLALLTAVWTGSEYLRGSLFTGFAWNPLGVSQYRNLTLLQVASWGGVSTVSALVVLVNAAIAVTVIQYVDAKGHRPRRPHIELMTGLACLALAFAHGWRTLSAPVEPGQPLRVAMIQPAIPQSDKWDRETVDMIYERLGTLTDSALRSPGLDLLIWPETALPDDVRRSKLSYDLVYQIVTNGVPLLVGSMDTEWKDDREPVYYNSSFLFDTLGLLKMGYDKQHLVMFGEYIPLQRFLPFIAAMTPIEASFTPGSTSTVFRLESPAVEFSVLICFEDTVASLARRSVLNGARLIINQTNDAWFDVSAGSRQHMAHSVLRCVENRVPIIRVANTGVTCCIDPYGRIYDVLEQEDGNTIFHGFVCSSVDVPGLERKTFYTRRGDLVGRACAVVTLAFLVAMAWPGIVSRMRMWRR